MRKGSMIKYLCCYPELSIVEWCYEDGDRETESGLSVDVNQYGLVTVMSTIDKSKCLFTGIVPVSYLWK